MTDYSHSPDGESFALPSPAEHEAERARIEALVEEARAQEREVVVEAQGG